MPTAISQAAIELTAYTVKITAGGYWEMPSPTYTGGLAGIWDAANGAARITETS